MEIIIRPYQQEDIEAMVFLWNAVVEDGIAFPQLEYLTEITGEQFFAEQSLTAVAQDKVTLEIVGLYILHPNNIGRCGHICNSSYAVSSKYRGKHIGEQLVRDSLSQGKKLGFRIIQFNAVVATNYSARHLYEKIGFKPLGIIPGGFLMKDGRYEDICPYIYDFNWLDH